MVAMLKPQFTRCDLRMSGTIIGAVWLVFSVVVTVGAQLAMGKLQQKYEEEYKDFTGTVTPELMFVVAITMAVFRTIFHGLTAIAAVEGVFSTMLIMGACQDKPRLVLPWVMGQLGLLPIWILLVLALIVYCSMAVPTPVTVVMLLLLVVRTGATVYSIQLVYRLYTYLRRNQVPTNPIRAV